jgi:uncharacterized Zn finger protein (UPF0148 family)
MEVRTVACASCGAPLEIPSDVDSLTCTYCGAAQVVRRGEGYVALKMAEAVSRTIEETGDETQSAIREGTVATQAELKRLQLRQDLSGLEVRLSSVQSEIRALQRQGASREASIQLQELRSEERTLMHRVQGLQRSLARGADMSAISAPEAVPVRRGAGAVAEGKDWLTTLLLCTLLGVFGAHRFYTGHTVLAVIQLLTAGGFLVWWLIDLLVIALGRFRDANGLVLANRKPAVGVGCLSAVSVLVAVMVGASVAPPADGTSDPTACVAGLAAGVFAFGLAYLVRRRSEKR